MPRAMPRCIGLQTAIMGHRTTGEFMRRAISKALSAMCSIFIVIQPLIRSGSIVTFERFNLQSGDQLTFKFTDGF